MPLHERMPKFLSSYSDSEVTFLLEVSTNSVEPIHEESQK